MSKIFQGNELSTSSMRLICRIKDMGFRKEVFDQIITIVYLFTNTNFSLVHYVYKYVTKG
jgi:hypothetical protein